MTLGRERCAVCGGEGYLICAGDPTCCEACNGSGVETQRETSDADAATMQSLYDAVGAFKDVLIDLEALRAASADVLRALCASHGSQRVYNAVPGPDPWCVLCHAPWARHTEVSPECPAGQLAERLAKVRR